MRARIRLTDPTALLGAVLVSWTPAVAATQTHPRPSVELIEGIPLDSARGLLFAPAAARGIAAFEVATGNEAWSYPAATA